MKKLFKIPKLVSDVYEYESTMEIDCSVLGMVAAFFGVIVYVVNFNNVNDVRVVIATYFVGTALILLPFILKRVENKKPFLQFFIVFLGVALTLYGLFGVNEGISYLWSLLTIFVILIQFGMPIGLPWCTFFLVFSIVIFWTPVREIMPYKYSDEYAFAFPWMYICDFGASFVGNLFYKKSRIEAMKQKESLQQDLEDALMDIDQAMFESVAIISTLIDEKDAYTKEHSVRVAKYARMIAMRCGFADKPKALRALYTSAYLHDIGKIAVPDNILNNRVRLDDDQYEIMKKHTVWGGEILKELTFLPKISIGATYHHERYDGKGYPNGAKGLEIPIEGRIITVADTLDAMNSRRVYRAPCSREYILDVFRNDNGQQFDPEIAKAVCELIEEGMIKIEADDNKD